MDDGRQTRKGLLQRYERLDLTLKHQIHRLTVHSPHGS